MKTMTELGLRHESARFLVKCATLLRPLTFTTYKHLKLAYCGRISVRKQTSPTRLFTLHDITYILIESIK